MNIDADIAQDMRSAEQAQCELNLAMTEFHIAAKFGDWPRAEGARELALSHLEAHMDAVARAWKRTEIARGG